MDKWCRQDRESMLFNPEDVLMASGMEPASVAAFLHENYLNFVHEDSVEDAAAACNYLSDAGPPPACLATPLQCPTRANMSEHTESEMYIVQVKSHHVQSLIESSSLTHMPYRRYACPQLK
jgi:hypothetical protein